MKRPYAHHFVCETSGDFREVLVILGNAWMDRVVGDHLSEPEPSQWITDLTAAAAGLVQYWGAWRQGE